MNKDHIRHISILGSTGSIGTQTLDIVRAYPDRFKAVALTARRNWELLAAQAVEVDPELVVIGEEDGYRKLKEALKSTGIRVACGEEGFTEAATLEKADIVVGAMVGYSGLPHTIAALESGKTVALANKETLVVAGEIIEEIVGRMGKRILPVDSEHSAIFQCLQGEERRSVRRLILTASGGPFRTKSLEELESATVDEALNHPNWDMGVKVTIDSATMMNKGFEMIEAKWIFRTPPEAIEVVVHPESIVHSMVEFIDGSVKAQLGLPDMRTPIEVALAYPERLDMLRRLELNPLQIAEYGSLTFEKPDYKKFPLLQLAYDVAEGGGLLPAVMNAANEVAVAAFLDRKIKFGDISRVVAESVAKGAGVPLTTEGAVSLENIKTVHEMGTDIANRLVKNIYGS